MTAAIKFNDPPPPHRGVVLNDWPAVVEACKQRPGEWAELEGHYSKGTRHHAASLGLQVTLRSLPREEWAGQYRSTRFHVWVRWPADEATA